MVHKLPARGRFARTAAARAAIMCIRTPRVLCAMHEGMAQKRCARQRVRKPSALRVMKIRMMTLNQRR